MTKLVNRKVLIAQLCPTWQPHGLWPARLLCPWNFPGNNSGVDSHSLIRGIFWTQGLNPCLLHCKQILYHLSHQGTSEIHVTRSKDTMKNYEAFSLL